MVILLLCLHNYGILGFFPLRGIPLLFFLASDVQNYDKTSPPDRYKSIARKNSLCSAPFRIAAEEI